MRSIKKLSVEGFLFLHQYSYIFYLLKEIIHKDRPSPNKIEDESALTDPFMEAQCSHGQHGPAENRHFQRFFPQIMQSRAL